MRLGQAAAFLALLQSDRGQPCRAEESHETEAGGTRPAARSSIGGGTNALLFQGRGAVGSGSRSGGADASPRKGRLLRRLQKRREGNKLAAATKRGVVSRSVLRDADAVRAPVAARMQAMASETGKECDPSPLPPPNEEGEDADDPDVGVLSFCLSPGRCIPDPSSSLGGTCQLSSPSYSSDPFVPRELQEGGEERVFWEGGEERVCNPGCPAEVCACRDDRSSESVSSPECLQTIVDSCDDGTYTACVGGGGVNDEMDQVYGQLECAGNACYLEGGFYGGGCQCVYSQTTCELLKPICDADDSLEACGYVDFYCQYAEVCRCVYETTCKVYESMCEADASSETCGYVDQICLAAGFFFEGGAEPLVVLLPVKECDPSLLVNEENEDAGEDPDVGILSLCPVTSECIPDPLSSLGGICQLPPQVQECLPGCPAEVCTCLEVPDDMTQNPVEDQNACFQTIADSCSDGTYLTSCVLEGEIEQAVGQAQCALFTCYAEEGFYGEGYGCQCAYLQTICEGFGSICDADGSSGACGYADQTCQLASIYCDGGGDEGGVVPPSDTCQVCPGGTTLPDPSTALVHSRKFGTECGDLALKAAAISSSDPACHEAQALSIVDCGCPHVPPPQTGCTLCKNGEAVPDPSLQLNPLDESSLCGVLEWQASFFDPDDKDEVDQKCRTIMATAGRVCGCPNANETVIPCDVECPGGEELELTKVLNNTIIGDYRWSGEWMCVEILWEMSTSVDLVDCTPLASKDVQRNCCPNRGIITDTPSPVPMAAPSSGGVVLPSLISMLVSLVVHMYYD